jgi:hypothetical protein
LNTEISVGPINVKYMGESQTQAVTMSGGDPILATQHLAFITGPDGIALETAPNLISANGDRDVRVLETGDTPSPYSRLGHGGRLGVYPSAISTIVKCTCNETGRGKLEQFTTRNVFGN